VEPFHLFRYLDEQAYRFNTRKLEDAERFDLAVRQIVGKRLTWEVDREDGNPGGPMMTDCPVSARVAGNESAPPRDLFQPDTYHDMYHDIYHDMYQVGYHRCR
jgi:hypothetical protein